MSELFLELFSEEMPSGLQKHAREGIQKLFTESFDKLNINFKSNKSYSTPKRLVFFFEEITEKIEKKGITIKGPKVDSPKSALEGFVKFFIPPNLSIIFNASINGHAFKS